MSIFLLLSRDVALLSKTVSLFYDTSSPKVQEQIEHSVESLLQAKHYLNIAHIISVVNQFEKDEFNDLTLKIDIDFKEV